MKKLLMSLLLLTGTAFAQQTATTTTDPGQIYSTGNLVQMTTTTSGSTWANGVYQDQLSCMAMGMPGNCGPNPSVRPGNLINYSYGYTDLYQVHAISSVLPTTGLRVNGYNFGFMAKNGNGWDDGRVDQLNAYVAFYGTDGKVKDYTNYDLNSKFDWTQFNYSKDFVTPYADKDLSTVRYGFTGADNNFWAGNYGPEIYNITFSLKYSVDPCAKDPLSSPTCPGYFDALNKLLPPLPASEPITTSTGITVTSEPVATVAPLTAPVTTTTTTQASAVAPIVSAPAPATTPTSSSTSNSTTTSAAATRENTGANTAQALSIISRNQDRDRETLAIAQTAVSAAASAAASAQQEAAVVAAAAVANSTANNAGSVAGANHAGSGFRSTASNNNAVTQSSTLQLMSGLTTVAANSPQTQSVSTATISSSSFTEAAPLTQTQSLPVANVSSTTTDNNIAANSNFLMDRTNPINNTLEQRPQLPTGATQINSGPTVNTKASDNEAAGGVTIATIAVAPQGYGDYLNLAMRDAAFYAPREVYRNQRTVDNARALRLLTNDSRHRDMVEQQYRR